MELLRDEHHVHHHERLFKLSLPPYMFPILLDYVDRAGLRELFGQCMLKQPRSFTVEAPGTFRWNVRKRPLVGPNSNMYWISPANLETHNNLLSHLAVGGLGAVLSALHSASGVGVIGKFTVFQATFLVVSSYTELQFHVDFDEALARKFWTVIVPIDVVSGSPSELIVQSHSQRLVEVKYRLGEVVIFGADVVHSTAIVEYSSSYRVCLSLCVGDICVRDVHLVLPDITQQFPPKSCDYLLSWGHHWSSTSPLQVVNIPELSDAALLGMHWMSMLCELKQSISSQDYSQQLLQWMAYQRYCYSLKYRRDISLYGSSSDFVRRASRSLTRFRETKLVEVGFQFVVDRDAGRKHHRWLVMFRELSDFCKAYGHCNVTKKYDRRLYFWLQHQKRQLSESVQLSNTKVHRRDMLINLVLVCLCNIIS